MKRRQVISGLIGVTAVGLIPNCAQRVTQMDTELPSLVVAGDIDPPQLDPVHDSENRFSPVNNHVEDVAVVTDPGPSVSAKDSKGSQHLPPVSVTVTSKSLETSTDSVPTEPQSKTKAPLANKLAKNILFDHDYQDDLWVSESDKPLLHSVALRFRKLQSTVGYGHFNVLGFDDALRFAKRYNQVGEFTPQELDFIEQVFFTDAADYGFYGKKVTDSLTSNINKKDVIKVPYTGHYLFKDQSLHFYEKVHKSVGDSIVLTSGIRSTVKQLNLFLAKAVRVKGNLSRASRSLAPPGYSYHGIGDFDVGRKGWGGKNFTDAFAETDEFKRMLDLGFVAIRYDEGNNLGVRFEPWHIQVV